MTANELTHIRYTDHIIGTPRVYGWKKTKFGLESAVLYPGHTCVVRV